MVLWFTFYSFIVNELNFSSKKNQLILPAYLWISVFNIHYQYFPWEICIFRYYKLQNYVIIIVFLISSNNSVIKDNIQLLHKRQQANPSESNVFITKLNLHKTSKCSLELYMVKTDLLTTASSSTSSYLRWRYTPHYRANSQQYSLHPRASRFFPAYQTTLRLRCKIFMAEMFFWFRNSTGKLSAPSGAHYRQKRVPNTLSDISRVNYRLFWHFFLSPMEVHKKYILRGDLNSVVCLRVTSPGGGCTKASIACGNLTPYLC